MNIIDLQTKLSYDQEKLKSHKNVSKIFPNRFEFLYGGKHE